MLEKYGHLLADAGDLSAREDAAERLDPAGGGPAHPDWLPPARTEAAAQQLKIAEERKTWRRG